MVNQSHGWLVFIKVRAKVYRSVNDRIWPTAAINRSEFRAQTMAALWPGPEPTSMDGALAASDPLRN